MNTLIDYKSPEKEIILESLQYYSTLDSYWISTIIENYIYHTIRIYYTKEELESDKIKEVDSELEEESDTNEVCKEDNSTHRLIKFEYRTKYGIKDGECKRWSTNGQLIKHYFNKNGNIEGEFKQWWSNGKLRELVYFKNNHSYGLHQSWYKDGLPRYYYTLKEEEPHNHIGFYIHCRENGNLNHMLYYKDDGECKTLF